MSQLLARILLAVLVIPLAGLVYMTTFFIWLGITRFSPDERLLIGAGLVTWLFMALYWIALWRSVVRWTFKRVMVTIGCALAAAIVAAGVGAIIGDMVDEAPGYFIASITAPILWLAGTVVIWRESKQERAERLRNANSDTVVCPTCGYNLTGLSESRCPECGGKFTLNDLLAAQSGRKLAEIEEG